jgi:ATP-binding cassette subfamily C protein CydC
MKTFLRLLAFLTPFRWQVLLSMCLGFLTAACSIILLSTSGFLISDSALVSFLALLIIPVYIVQVSGVVRAGARYTERMASHTVTFQLLARLRTWFYQRLEPLAPAQIQEYRSGEMLSHLVNDIEELQNIYLRIVAPFATAILVAILTFWIFSLFDLVLAYVMLSFLITTGVGVPLLAGWLSKGLGRRQLQTRADLNTQMIDGIQGMQDLLAFGSAPEQQRKIQQLNTNLSQIQRRMAYISGIQQAILDLLMNIAVLVIFMLALPLVLTHTINGVYLAFLLLFIMASFETLQPLAQAIQFLGHSLSAGERLFQIADTQPAIKADTQPSRVECALQENASTTQIPTAYRLECEHINFSYDQLSGEVLHDISFTIQSGKRLAIVGPSGSGKSTLVKLLLRFWDTSSGIVKLNGHDIRGYSVKHLRHQLGIVAQDTYLFNNTIRYNLLLARPDASDAELKGALEQAQLLQFVDQLPLGLETCIGEQGLRLSGGEQQRVAIARTLLKNAPFLILDEATANLDALTEEGLLETLDLLMQTHATLIITHRLIAMERMDEIIVLDQGHICERGTHQELIQAHGLYWSMVDTQNTVLDVV